MKTILFVMLCSILLMKPALSQTYTVGVENLKYLPYYTTEKGEYSGFAKEVLDAFAHSKGYTFKYEPYAISSLFLKLIYKKVDFKFPDSPYWRSDLKKDAKVTYSNSVVDYVDGVMVLPENKGKGLGALKKLGVVLGFSPWALMDEINGGKIIKQENPSFEGMFNMVLTRKIDGAYINPNVARYVLGHTMKKSETSLVQDPGLPEAKGSYLLSSVSQPKVISEFNEWLKKNKGVVDQLKAKYKIGLD